MREKQTMEGVREDTVTVTEKEKKKENTV